MGPGVDEKNATLEKLTGNSVPMDRGERALRCQGGVGAGGRGPDWASGPMKSHEKGGFTMCFCSNWWNISAAPTLQYEGPPGRGLMWQEPRL